MSPYLPSPIRVARPNCKQTQEPEGQQGFGVLFSNSTVKNALPSPSSKTSFALFHSGKHKATVPKWGGELGSRHLVSALVTAYSGLLNVKKDQLHSRHLAASLHGTWFSLLHSTHTHFPTQVGPAHRHLSCVMWTDTMPALLRAPPSQLPRHRVLAKKASRLASKPCGGAGSEATRGCWQGREGHRPRRSLLYLGTPGSKGRMWNKEGVLSGARLGIFPQPNGAPAETPCRLASALRTGPPGPTSPECLHRCASSFQALL